MFQPVILKFKNHVDFIVIGLEYVLLRQLQLPYKYFTLGSPLIYVEAKWPLGRLTSCSSTGC